MTHRPITPPPELVEQWYDCATAVGPDYLQEIADRAAQWGADQELEACSEEFSLLWDREEIVTLNDVLKHLRTTRRPKPPSLKEQALQALAEADAGLTELEWPQCSDTIRRALEQLDD